MRKLFFMVSFMVCVMLVACGPAEQVREDDRTFRTAISIEPESTNALQIISADVVAVFDNVFDALLTFDSRGELSPNLAINWRVYDENRRYVAQLQKGVLFHNGEELTAADVVHTYTVYPKYTSRFSHIESVVALDDYTVEFTLSQSDGDFSNLVATTWIFSASEGEEPISGTGAYAFDRYEAGRILYFKRFDKSHYHKDGLSYFNKLEFMVMKEAASVLMALQSGAIDMATQVELTTIDAAMRNQLQVVPAAQNLTNLMAFNNDRAPFNDINVRKAINFAVDKDAVIRLSLDGEGERLDTGMSVVLSHFYNHSLHNFYPYDPEQAKSLLAASGYTESNPLRFVVRVPSNYSLHMRTAEIIASQLASAGIEMTIEPVEWAIWLSDVYREQNYQATIVGLTGKLSAYQQLVKYSQVATTNLTNFKNDDFDAALDRALLSTTDAGQVEAFHLAQYILADQAASLFLVDPNLAMVSRKNLHGWHSYPIRTYRVREYWID
jgi:peptide/nickel transport system substrate-binding protein